MSILTVLMLLMATLLDQVQKSWRFGEDKLGQFREARVAFDLIAKNLSQAASNTYWDYTWKDAGGIQMVDSYEKRSELHFYVTQAASAGLPILGQTQGHAAFFQAPLGYSLRYRNLSNLFNARGYLVVYGSDKGFRPSFVFTERYRFRLMEFRPPAEANQVFEDAINELEAGQPKAAFTGWWKQGLTAGANLGSFSDHLNPLAENIILLLITPQDSIETQSQSRYDFSSAIAPNYSFDSNVPPPTRPEIGQQVPPLVRITMVAIDESTAVQLEARYQSQMPADLVPSGLFKSVADYSKDIEALIEHLNNYGRDNGTKINFRIFSTIVMLRSAKWSTEIPPQN